MSKEKLPTAVEFLRDLEILSIYNDRLILEIGSSTFDLVEILKDFSEQQNSYLQKQLEDKNVSISELIAWKESAMEVFGRLNLPEIGKELGVKLGSDIARLVLPGIRNLKNQMEEQGREIEKVQDLCGKYKDELIELQAKQPEINLNAFSCAVAEYDIEHESLKAERAKLREALEVAMKSLATYGEHPIIEKQAKEALKQ